MFLKKYVKARHILFLQNIIKMFGDKHVVNQGAESHFLNHKLPVSDLDLITSASSSPSDTAQRRGHGGLWYCGIELFFSSGISVIFILMYGITVSSSPAVCGFSSFWLTVFGKRRSFTVLRYCSFGLSCLMQVNIWKTLDLTVNEYTISDSYSMMWQDIQ